MPIRTIHDINRQTVSSVSDNESIREHQQKNIHDQNSLERENMFPSAAATTGSTKIGNQNNNVVDTLIQNTFIIPTLPNGTTTAKDMLQRIVREFAPIIQQRNYNIVSVSELCCCSDGLSHKKNQSIGSTTGSTATTITNNNNKRRRQPITIKKKKNQNLWGYNRSSYRTDRYGNNQSMAHEIHIRLRCFNDHTKMLDYDDIAGTMAHELAHCEVSPHNDKFYKVMDSIIDQHAVLLSSNLTTTSQYDNRQPLIPFTGTGYKVGNTDTNTNTDNINNIEAAATTTTAVAFNPFTGNGTKLGGDTIFTQFMTPKEAAVVAADARRRQQQIRLRIRNQSQQYHLLQQKNSNRNSKTQDESNSNDDTVGCCGTISISIDDDDDENDNDNVDDDTNIDLEAKSQKFFSDNNETAFCQPCGAVKSNTASVDNDCNDTKKSKFKNCENVVVLLDDDDDDVDHGKPNASIANNRPDPNNIPKQASSAMSSIAARAVNKLVCIDLTEDNYTEETSAQLPPDGTTITAGLMKGNHTPTTLSQSHKNQAMSRKSYNCQVCTFLNWYSKEDCKEIRQANDVQIVQCEMCSSDNYLY